MPISAGVLKIFKGKVTYSDTSPVTICTIPAGCVLIGAFVNVTTAWSGTSPTVDVGDSADPDGIIPNASIDLATTGFQALKENEKGAYLWDSANGVSQYHVFDADTDIQVTIGGTDLTAGEVEVYLLVIDARII